MYSKDKDLSIVYLRKATKDRLLAFWKRNNDDNSIQSYNQLVSIMLDFCEQQEHTQSEQTNDKEVNQDESIQDEVHSNDTNTEEELGGEDDEDEEGF